MAWEVLGAMIGAGFASGRELATFFARFGGWSWLGVAAAALLAGAVLARVLALGPEMFRRRSWRAVFLLLSVTAAGAMIAAAGELTALCLPLRPARYLGMGLMLALGLADARRQTPLLRRISRVLTAALLLMLAACLALPVQRAVRVEARPAPLLTALQALLHGVCYGGLNMALAAPMAAEEGAGLPRPTQQRTVLMVALMLGTMVGLGNLLLLRQPMALHAPLPLAQLTASFGRAGFYGCCIVMLLAVLTTLMAALRGMDALLPPHRRALGPAAAAAVALLGFEGIVTRLYPALGGVCALMLLCPRTGKTAAGGRKNVG